MFRRFVALVLSLSLVLAPMGNMARANALYMTLNNATQLYGFAGQAYDFVVNDVWNSKTSKHVRLIWALSQGADAEAAYASAEIPPPAGWSAPALPATIARTMTGGTISGYFKPATVSGYAYNGVDISSRSPEDFVQTLKVMPSGFYMNGFSDLRWPWAVFSGMATGSVTISRKYGSFQFFSHAPIGSDGKVTMGCVVLVGGTAGGPCTYMQASTGATGYTLTGAYVTITATGNSGGDLIFEAPLVGAQWSDCPVGYSPNAANASQCQLTDSNAARADGGYFHNGSCIWGYGAAPEVYDPECDDLKNNGVVSVEQTPTGPVLVVRDPQNPGTVTAYKRNADGSTQISRTTKNSDGSVTRTDALAYPDGRFSPITGTNFPQNPPPEYPGQDPSQPEGDPDVQFPGYEPLDPDPELPEEAIPVGVGSVSDVSVPVSNECPFNALGFDIPLGDLGTFTLTDNGLLCQLLDTYDDAIRNVSIASAFIAGLFIILGA